MKNKGRPGRQAANAHPKPAAPEHHSAAVGGQGNSRARRFTPFTYQCRVCQLFARAPELRDDIGHLRKAELSFRVIAEQYASETAVVLGSPLSAQSFARHFGAHERSSQQRNFTEHDPHEELLARLLARIRAIDEAWMRGDAGVLDELSTYLDAVGMVRQIVESKARVRFGKALLSGQTATSPRVPLSVALRLSGEDERSKATS